MLEIDMQWVRGEEPNTASLQYRTIVERSADGTVVTATPWKTVPYADPPSPLPHPTLQKLSDVDLSRQPVSRLFDNVSVRQFMRLLNIFRVYNIRTIGDLQKYSRAEIQDFRGFGTLCSRDFDKVIKANGIKLRPNSERRNG